MTTQKFELRDLSLDNVVGRLVSSATQMIRFTVTALNGDYITSISIRKDLSGNIAIRYLGDKVRVVVRKR